MGEGGYKLKVENFLEIHPTTAMQFSCLYLSIQIIFSFYYYFHKNLKYYLFCCRSFISRLVTVFKLNSINLNFGTLLQMLGLCCGVQSWIKGLYSAVQSQIIGLYSAVQSQIMGLYSKSAVYCRVRLWDYTLSLQCTVELNYRTIL